MTSTVSVIIPTWNRGSELPLAISSALGQTVPPFEILICDDGSDDGSEAAVRAFNDHRVRWLPGSHAGRPAVPKNRGLAVSKGEWIAFLDSDDQWLPEKLERQLQRLHGLRYKAICSNAYRSSPENKQIKRFLTWSKTKITFDDLLYTNYVVCSSAVIHHSLIADVVGFPERHGLTVGEDYALWLRVATCTDFAYLPEPLVIYKDDPQHSVRCDGPDDTTQKRAVIQDFLKWADTRKLPPIFKSRAEQVQSPSSLRVKCRQLKHVLLRMRERVM